MDIRNFDFNSFLTELKKSPSKRHPIQLVFDIDESIVNRLISDEQKWLVENDPAFEWFKKNNLLFDYSFVLDEIETRVLCLLHPGVVELFQYVTQLPDVKISFFSSAREDINLEFVERFLTRVLGSEGYAAIKNDVSIFSNHHCKKDDGNDKKDLSVTLQHGESIRHCLLIEDNPSFIDSDQVRNAFLIPDASFLHFKCSNRDDIYRANHILFFAGMFSKALELGRSDYLDNLYDLQCGLHTHEKIWSYFLMGLELLQKKNPELTLFTNGADLKAMNLKEPLKKEIYYSNKKTMSPGLFQQAVESKVDHNLPGYDNTKPAMNGL